jgi:hypothetical protein
MKSSTLNIMYKIHKHTKVYQISLCIVVLNVTSLCRIELATMKVQKFACPESSMCDDKQKLNKSRR